MREVANLPFKEIAEVTVGPGEHREKPHALRPRAAAASAQLIRRVLEGTAEDVTEKDVTRND